MGTLSEEIHGGMLSKSLPDEPLFPLMARDPSAPGIIRQWAAQRRSDIDMGRKPASDMAVVQNAYETADRMEAWRKQNDGAWRTGLFGQESGS